DAGLISVSQAETMLAGYRVELKRTNLFLRAALALFTGLVVAAVVFFVVESLGLRSAADTVIVSGVASVAWLCAAEMLVGAFSLYRFGVEEMLGACSAILLSVCLAEAARLAGDDSLTIALSVAAIGGLGLYLRFGFVWAALGSMCCLAALPFQFHVSAEASRAGAAVLIGLVFVLTRVQRLRHGEEWPGDEYGVLQAAAPAGPYPLFE